MCMYIQEYSPIFFARKRKNIVVLQRYNVTLAAEGCKKNNKTSKDIVDTKKK